VSANDGSLFRTYGNATIENNINIPGGVRPDGFGIQALSASKIQVANCFGTNQISGNQSGGIDVRENSRLSIWDCGTVGGNIVNNNGPVGLEIGSEGALYGNVVISGHTGPGVDLYAQSQLYMYGANVVSNNGSAGDPRSAGVVADGNSEVFLRGGTISANAGPGILALVNSSVDSVGATFSGNTRGIATCDSSAYMVSDLLPAAVPYAAPSRQSARRQLPPGSARHHRAKEQNCRVQKVRITQVAGGSSANSLPSAEPASDRWTPPGAREQKPPGPRRFPAPPQRPRALRDRIRSPGREGLS
jgi:hypothetical protein